MGSAQTVILPYGQPAGYAGQLFIRLDSASAANKEASLNIDFGLGVSPGTNVEEALLPSTNSSLLLGVNLNTQVYAPGTFGDIDQSSSASKGVIPNQFMDVLTQGECFVQVDGDTVVVPNITRLYLRFESDGGSYTKRGTFRSTDDGHVTDTRNLVLAIGPIVPASDALNGGTTKICRVHILANIKQ